ncbi:hypothetical protein K2X85_09415 [bacterium]|nr:hypothetical protein [bacterium]
MRFFAQIVADRFIRCSDQFVIVNTRFTFGSAELSIVAPATATTTSTTTTAASFLGFGLAISRLFLPSHGGSFGLASFEMLERVFVVIANFAGSGFFRIELAADRLVVDIIGRLVVFVLITIETAAEILVVIVGLGSTVEGVGLLGRGLLFIAIRFEETHSKIVVLIAPGRR